MVYIDYRLGHVSDVCATGPARAQQVALKSLSFSRSSRSDKVFPQDFFYHFRVPVEFLLIDDRRLTTDHPTPEHYGGQAGDGGQHGERGADL